MEEKEKWYIRGKKGCAEQIRKEFIKRGADDPTLDKEFFGEEEFIYYLECGLVRIAEYYSMLGERIIANWKEVKVEEPKPKPTFKPYDKVLACDGNDTYWFATEFSCYNPNDIGSYYRIIDGVAYKYCLPYEGNEHLNGVKFKQEHIEGYEWGE
jgi:hypothetical protein